MKALEFGRDINGKDFITRVEFLTAADMGPAPREEPEPGNYPRKPSRET